ncbi:MAG: (d)CMP kinase [Ignavibacteriae bacterium]|nr:(d)CMP kinase [Ignavibacteriota bacterium]
MKELVIAIDGPAASGKSTTARVLANRLGYLFVDTGAMYRAMTLKVLERKLDLHSEASIAALASQTEIQIVHSNGELRVLLDQRDVTEAIRRPEVTRAVSRISAMKCVRDVMVREQRRMGAEGGIVLEGRDIGTVVFPQADVKFFLVADVEKRARRRQKELHEQGTDVQLTQLKKEILERDQKDSERNISPLRKADDAITLDTSNLTIEEQVDFIVEKVHDILQSRQ